MAKKDTDHSRFEDLKKHGRELVEDGHSEGWMILELVGEVERLRKRKWTPERLHNALDTLAALWLVSPEGKSLGGTSVLELIEWSAARLRAADESKVGTNVD